MRHISRRYGALTNDNVHVEVYVPTAVLAGTANVHVGVTVWLPRPVFTAALYNFVAVGAVAAAGSVYG
jgi:hypothetical protein